MGPQKDHPLLTIPSVCTQDRALISILDEGLTETSEEPINQRTCLDCSALQYKAHIYGMFVLVILQKNQCVTLRFNLKMS